MTEPSIVSPTSADRAGEPTLALACAMIALGGLLLGLQIDGGAAIVGTGYTPLALGALVALIATLVQIGAKGRPPRDPLTALSAAAGFLGVAYLVGGVLAPGGAWMFWELVLLLWVLARRRSLGPANGPQITGGALFLLGLMLVFRIWITWQASRHDWQLFTIAVPWISLLPFGWLDPIKTITVGDFTQQEMGFPPTGLDFPLSMLAWSAGFALCAGGLWMRGRAAREVEIERVHALIELLPAKTALLVHRLLPEPEWETLDLLGLPRHRLARRIETLVLERVERLMQVEAAFHATRLLDAAGPDPFTLAIHQALGRYRGAPELAPPGRPDPDPTRPA